MGLRCVGSTVCYTYNVMKAQMRAAISESVLDPTFPWKLPKLKWKFCTYPYKKSVGEWRRLLARAEDGDAEAQSDVAAMYDDGCMNRSGRILVRRSARKTVEWYRRAAELGHANAQNNLGVILSAPGATETSRVEAIAWLKKAARAGSSCAVNNLAITYREDGDLRRAVFWFRKCVVSGDDGACVELGIHCYWGRGMRTDLAAAVRYFRKATKGKNLSEAERDDAFFYLGIAYLEGNGVKASLLKGRKLLERANIDNDHLAASRLLKGLRASPPR